MVPPPDVGGGHFSAAVNREPKMASRFLEPPPRWGHFSAAVNGELYVFGGVTDENEGENVVHVFNQRMESWQTRATKGRPPPGRYHGACTSSGQCIYHYGGCDGSYQDSLYQLDTRTLEWSQLPSGPMKKDGCEMICYQDHLLLFGGYGLYPGTIQPGAEFLGDERFAFHDGWTNEFHSFDLKEGEDVGLWLLKWPHLEVKIGGHISPWPMHVMRTWCIGRV